MQHEQTIEFGQQALMTTLTLIAPILIVAILVGLLVGVIQAMTQVQDQTISYIPKLICILVALCYSLPWMLERLSSFTGTVFQSIPNTFREVSDAAQPSIYRINAGSDLARIHDQPACHSRDRPRADGTAAFSLANTNHAGCANDLTAYLVP